MPFPRAETTPPVTKMKRVCEELSGIWLWAASLARAAEAGLSRLGK